MIPNESSNGTGASRGLHLNLPFAKPPDRPMSIVGGFVEGGIVCLPVGSRMPIVPVGLDDQPGRLEYKVGLETSEHRLVHFKFESSLLELISQQPLDACHLIQVPTTQTSLAALFPHLSRVFTAKLGLPQLLSCFRRMMLPNYLWARLAKMREFHLTACFR